jgi:CRP/FNR family cyclic AMP-dependent transcriptional regulator
MSPTSRHARSLACLGQSDNGVWAASIQPAPQGPGNDLAFPGSQDLVDNAVFRYMVAHADSSDGTRFRPVDLKCGDMCLRRSDTVLMFVTSGLVKSTRQSRDGRALTLEVFGPGDTLGAESLIDPEGSPEDYLVVQNGSAIRLDATWATQAMLEHSSISIAFSKELAYRLRQRQDRVARLKSAAASALVAEWVLDLGDLPPQRSRLWRRSVLVRQDEIAKQVGVARHTVNASLRSFVRRGWLLRDGESWSIVDRDAIERHAGRAQVATAAS